MVSSTLPVPRLSRCCRAGWLTRRCPKGSPWTKVCAGVSSSRWPASARSAAADADLKAAAWHLATEDPTVPNETYRHITRSFIQPGQEDLLEPYAAKYLQLCEQISTGQGQWANAGHAQVQNALTFLFPATLADRAWLDGLYSWMRDAELNSTVLRVLLERADMAERALHCQNASGARG